MNFPQDFVWGAATASYQIEGAVEEDGRGECIWHRFSHTPNKVDNGDTGDVACDHYHRYLEDIQIMQRLSLDAYRFSIAWARIFPQGTGQLNPKGVAFYDRLIDGLLAAGIQPYVTLYHWDLPQALQDRGGWANPDSVKWFADYTAQVAQSYGDRVKNWITFNEPWVSAFVGYFQGRHAPGITDFRMAAQAAHHLLLSHGAAVPILREFSPASQVGITINYSGFSPASEAEADIQAAARMDAYVNRWFTEPVYKGTYPAIAVDWLGDLLSHIRLEEVKAAAVPIDFLGVNYYFHEWHKNQSSDYPFATQRVDQPNATFTAMNWEVNPEAFRRLLLWLHQEYSPKAIYITENGSAWADPAPVNEVVEDPQRVAYLESHLQAVSEAMAGGSPVKGYFAWSLLDNFEWAYGYNKRFGVVSVDYATQKRTIKRSGLRYKEIIQASRG